MNNQQIMFVGEDVLMIAQIQRALAKPDKAYRLVGTSEPTEAVMAVKDYPFALVLVDLETDFDAGIATLYLFLGALPPGKPRRIALMRHVPQRSEMRQLVPSGVSNLITDITRHPATLRRLLER